MTDISNKQQVMDSRDIIERLDELQTMQDEMNETQQDYTDVLEDPELTQDDAIEYKTACDQCEEAFSAEDREELGILRALADEAEGYGDWEHGETLILGSHFVEYAQQLAEDIGAVTSDATWPNNHIDWEAAADALKEDYMTVDFDGVEYLMRA